METIIFDRLGEIKKHRSTLEKKLKVSITIQGRQVKFEGDSFDEYEASLVLDAINFGYSAETALILKEEDVVFHKLSIKDFTRRKNRKDVRARLIGTQGRTKRTIENLADARIIIKDNEIGLICPAEEVDYAITAITNLIRGSKQSNVYNFLERINASKKGLNKK